MEPDLRTRLNDAGYVAIGLAVIGWQRTQSAARTARADLGRIADTLIAAAEDARGGLRVQSDTLTARVDEALHLAAPHASRVRGLAGF